MQDDEAARRARVLRSALLHALLAAAVFGGFLWLKTHGS